jgi:phosphonate transport system ATP-binding protein
LELILEGVGASHPASRSGAAPALRGVSLRIAAGEQLAVIGPSGAGKTTLLHCAAAALRPGQGRVRLAGADPWRSSPAALRALRGRLFLAPQVPPLPPRQRVVTSVLAGRLPAMNLWTSVRSLFYPVDIAAAHAALTQFDIADKLFERVDRLSGGERQRVGLARALLAPATLWLIDEPLSALDRARAQQAIDTLCGVARERGHTLVTTLHDVEMALGNFARIVGLRDGAIAFDLPAGQVSPALLAQLYAQREHELRVGSAPDDDAEIPAPAPAAAPYCR